MKYIHVYHAFLGVWVAVPSTYSALVSFWYARYSHGFFELGYPEFGDYISFDDVLVRLPGSFIVR